MAQKLTKSLEKHLLAINNLLEEKNEIKVKDVALYLNFSGSTVADSVKSLREKGYVNYKPYGNITLTDLGKEAIMVKRYRHGVITNFLNRVLDIEPKKADESADAIEYSMTEDVLKRLVHFMDFMKQCTCSEPKWIKSCKNSLENGDMPEKCRECSGGCHCGVK